ncbi:MAG: tetratricopeptide repeat protein [Opitutales bacterium]|nr:tetratricopeptide repeat protein [Opitutales bacterium]MCH8541352.1 hypothetical protein [Opitutales bacterium]
MRLSLSPEANLSPQYRKGIFSSQSRWIGLLALFLYILPPLAAEEPLETAPQDPYEMAWDRLSKLLIVQAIERFEEAITRDGERAREAHLGLGIAHLNLQPKSRTTIQSAEEYLQKVKEVEANDDFGIRARYYLGRIEQIHRYTPDWDKAKDIFNRLHEDHPDHPMGELARVRWVTMRLYEPTDPETKAERFAETEAFRGSFVNSRTRRDYHLVMANAYTHFDHENPESQQLLLEHLMAAVEAGIHNRQTLASTYVRIAEMARHLENYPVADQFYGRFLDNFTRDNRVDWVADRRMEIQTYLEDSDDSGTDS